MRQRCLNPKHAAYADYGGRGITICEPWRAYETFLADMGEPPNGMSLDRKENDKGYDPENCRWATAKEQAHNRRNNRWITAFGKTLIMADWSREVGIREDVLCWRVSSGWDAEKALTVPVKKIRKRGKAWRVR
jgi:hypothetical protein